MRETSKRQALRARLVLPISSPPLDGGVVTIQGDKIVAVGENASAEPPRDLGDVALLPGLINAHTHLEFSELRTPLGEPGLPLPDWIHWVVTKRRENADRSGAVLSTERRNAAIRDGLSQCLQSGTTTVADIVTWDIAEEVLPKQSPRVLALRESIGLSRKRVEEQVVTSRNFLTFEQSTPSRFLRGLSPHAPYTAAPELVQQLVRLSQRHQSIVAMHLAESPEELRLLAHGDGPFRDLLQRFEAWDAAAFPGGKQPLDYLEMLTAAHRSLIVHGNYLDTDDWKLLARYHRNMSVVYCPRTHDYFRHPPYPLAAMLRSGVSVALGTDGRASNPDLALFEEMQFAAQRHTDVAPHDLLRLITLDAARSLGLEGQIGSLERGKSADMTVVHLGEVPASPHQAATALMHKKSKVCGVWVSGKRINLPA